MRLNKFESKDLEPSYDEYKGLIEQYEAAEAREALKPKVECGPHIEEFEEMLVPLLKEEVLAVLNIIETEEEARNSEERESAKEALIPLVDKMNFLKKRTDITEEEFDKLHEKYRIFSRAVGMINGGVVDHDR